MLRYSKDAYDHKLQYIGVKADLELHKICLGEARRALENERAKKPSVIYAAAAGQVALDEQLVGLIRLAVSNPEPKEGAAAAMIVCKRLKEMMS